MPTSSISIWPAHSERFPELWSDSQGCHAGFLHLIAGFIILAALSLSKQKRSKLEEGHDTGSEGFMLVVSASKTSKVLPVLMACLLAIVAVVCLVHTDGIADSQTAHQGHRHTSSSSATHFTLDLHCLVAILPGVVMLLWLCLGALYVSVLLSKPIVPAFPPFIPPKALARA